MLPPEAATFTTTQMVEMMQQMATTIATEMKRLTPREQAKQDKEDAQILRNEQESLQRAKSEIESREAKKRGCPHTMTHPATKVTWHRWVAQVHTPSHRKPYFVPLCQQCGTQLPEIAATQAMLTEGVQLDQYPTLNMETLENWAKLTPAQ